MKFEKKGGEEGLQTFFITLLPRGLGVLQLKHKRFATEEELGSEYLFDIANFMQ